MNKARTGFALCGIALLLTTIWWFPGGDAPLSAGSPVSADSSSAGSPVSADSSSSAGSSLSSDSSSAGLSATATESSPAAGGAVDSAAAAASSRTGEPYFFQRLAAWRQSGVPVASEAVAIDAAAPSARSDPAVQQSGTYEGKSNVLIWKAHGSGWIEYEFDVDKEALYEILVSYVPLKETGSKGALQWSVTIDGERPFREASALALYRTWQDVRPIITNADGDQIRPRSVDVSEWSVKPLVDATGAYAEPLLWHVAAGRHTLRIESYDAVALERIVLAPPEPVAAYADVSATYPDGLAGHSNALAADSSGSARRSGVSSADSSGLAGRSAASAANSNASAEPPVITLQAEQFRYKNDTAIKLYSDKDARTVPRYTGRITYNTVGANRWVEQNQEIGWTFEAPESGLYKFAFRALQNTVVQKSSFRTVRIDGSVPFAELLAYRFPYSADWQGRALEDASGRPYLFYLEKGEHTLSLAVTHAPVKPVIVELERLNERLDGIDWDLRKLTGLLGSSNVLATALDRNRTWVPETDFPGLTEQFADISQQLERLAERLEDVNGGRDSVSQGLRTAAGDLADLLRAPEDIPYHVNEISSIRERFGSFTETLLKQALQLDELYIVPAESELPEAEAGFFQGVWGNLQNLLYSFDTRNSLRTLDERKLNVWVFRGRDYVDQLQQLADESFTPETGIQVKVNLLPNQELLLMSNAAGVQPDMALGLTQDLPVDYAIRGTLEDLSQLEGFDDLFPQFSPGSWLPLYYNGGYYGAPETQSFQVLYYRKDILERLGADVPQTWDDVYLLLPTLQQNFMNFYLDSQQFSHFFYQNGVEFYTPDGLRSQLDEPAAFRAFKQWTDLYNTYAIEREVPSFYQHFRKGTMPIGISDYNMYVQLSAAAPELNGRWGIALIPGTVQEDGTIARWAGGGQRTGVIFRQSDKKDEAWQFLQWWLSADVQARYGSDLEAVNGVAFRWNTSNIEAFQRLPWKPADAEVILQQWLWYKDIPNVPGGYFLPREINNAWVRSVVRTEHYMTSLEQTVRDVNRELLRKQQEFGFIDERGRRLKPLSVPIVNEPWEGLQNDVE